MKFYHTFLTLLFLVGCQKNNNNVDISKSIKYFDFEKLSSEAKLELSKDYWLGTGKIKEITSSNGGIIINLSDDNYDKNLITTDDKIIISYAVDSDCQTIIYDKKSNKLSLVDLHIFATGLSEKNMLLVSRNYYDTKDPNDPNYKGHIFEKGKYDIKTGKYTFISND